MANPVVIGGDLHSFWVNDLKRDFDDPGSPTVATEFVGSSISSPGPSYQQFMSWMPDNPHVRYFESRQRGYVFVDLTAERMAAHFRTLSDVREPQATISTLRELRRRVRPARCGARVGPGQVTEDRPRAANGARRVERSPGRVAARVSIALAMLAVPAGARARFRIGRSASPSGATISADVRVTEDRLRVEIDSEGYRVDWAMLVRDGGVDVAPEVLVPGTVAAAQGGVSIRARHRDGRFGKLGELLDRVGSGRGPRGSRLDGDHACRVPARPRRPAALAAPGEGDRRRARRHRARSRRAPRSLDRPADRPAHTCRPGRRTRVS